MTPFAIAGMQLNLAGAGDNLPRMAQRLDYLMHLYPWVQMVVFSELAACGPSKTRAEPLPGPAERAFQAMAAHHGIWLVNGSYFELHEGRTYNTTSVIGPDGRVRFRYRKMFPFRPYEAGVDAGDGFTVFDIDGVGRFGISICYDMWFPETSRSIACLGAEVLLHPSLTGTIDRDVEVAMARATAAQNQMYVIDINGVGGLGNGRSVFVGPAGDVLHEAGNAEELIPLEIDLDRVRREREVGLRGLGQPLKSFRDSKTSFTVYSPGASEARAYLHTLGELRRPERGSMAGLDHAPPPAPEPEPRGDNEKKAKRSRKKRTPHTGSTRTASD
ncbi:MAG TPA: carbon-nitrogen hydrolase family protein [Longimicrobiales bacterium]|nr:carbon-nitrogen hydrolase family protein [Longimicrobiales bacterium]